jgi:hypothetical protein
MLACVLLVVPGKSVAHLVKVRVLAARQQHLAHEATVTFPLATVERDRLAENQAGQVLLGALAERLRAFGRVDTCEANAVRDIAAGKHGDGVSIGDANDACGEGVVAKCTRLHFFDAATGLHIESARRRTGARGTATPVGCPLKCTKTGAQTRGGSTAANWPSRPKENRHAKTQADANTEKPLSGLRTAAAELNSKSDAINETLKAAEDELVAMGLGLETWDEGHYLSYCNSTEYREDRDSEDPIPHHVERCKELGFAKVKGRWCLATRIMRYEEEIDSRGFEDTVETQESGPYRLADADRETRINALSLLSHLYAAMQERAAEAIRTVDEAVAKHHK